MYVLEELVGIVTLRKRTPKRRKLWSKDELWAFATTPHLSHLCAFLWHTSWQLTRFWFSVSSSGHFSGSGFGFGFGFALAVAMAPWKALHFHYVLLFVFFFLSHWSSCTHILGKWLHESHLHRYRFAVAAAAVVVVIAGHLKRLKYNT